MDTGNVHKMIGISSHWREKTRKRYKDKRREDGERKERRVFYVWAGREDKREQNGRELEVNAKATVTERGLSSIGNGTVALKQIKIQPALLTSFISELFSYRIE